MSKKKLVGLTLCALLASTGLVRAQGVPQEYTITGTNYNSAGCIISTEWCIPSNTYRLVNYAKDEVLLMLSNKAPDSTAEQLMKQQKLRAKQVYNFDSINMKLVVAASNGQDPFEVMQRINESETDIDAATNTIFYLPSSTLSKPGTGNEAKPGVYPFSTTGVLAAHKITKGRNVLIGMIDTPIDIGSREFRSSKIRRIDQVRPGSAKNQQHGTEVAGVMVSTNPRVGIAPEAGLFAVSAFTTQSNQTRTGTASLVAKALELSIKEGVDVLNLSFAGGQDKLVERLIRKAISRGIIVVASAGNGGPSAKPAYPAAIPGVISVTAVDSEKQIFPQANRGAYVDIAAPGVSIMTTAPRGSFHISSGTSLATAHVSAAIALMLSAKRGKFSTQLMKDTADDLGDAGKDNNFGYGLLNVPRMLSTMR